MNTWRIYCAYKDARSVFDVEADTLEIAIDKFRDANPNIPSLALYKVECVK